MRKLETEAGVIVGTVDRALRRVAWHLECPDCYALIAFTDHTFRGRGPLVCECGWKTRPIATKERSEDGSVYAYYDYEAYTFGSSKGCESGSEIGGIHAGMRL